MKRTLIVFRKELLDVLRDRRTLMAMLVVPLLVYPVLIGVMGKVMVDRETRAMTRPLTIGLIAEQPIAELDRAANRAGAVLLNLPDDTTLCFHLLRSDSVQALFRIPANFYERQDSLEQVDAALYYRSTNSDGLNRRIDGVRSDFLDAMVERRYEQLNLRSALLAPVLMPKIDLSSDRQQIGQLLGGILPYFFIIFCLLGCMYPAIDLAAGEKERGTMETLLTSPARRMELFSGKFLVVVLSGMTSAVVALIGLYASVRFNPDIPEQLTDMLMQLLSPASSLLLLAVLFPLAVFFASLMLALSIWARSFKEAQSYISPLMIVVILPALIAFLPGTEMTVTGAMIPIYNVVLAAKEILAGTAQALHLAITFLSLVLLAAIGMLVSSRLFASESVMLRA